MAMDLQCKTIICVDDEESVLESYKKILAAEDDDDISEILSFARERDGEEEDDANIDTAKLEYNLLLASSGEEAVKMMEKERAAGRRIAAGFFDMRMPGGMDGYQTIEKIRAMDSNVICAVVTAYTDRSVMQIRNLFTEEHQDELLYFKKPFAPEELEQTALNMVNSWNRKRKIEDHIRSIEKHKKGLRQILHAITTLTRVPPHSLQHLGSGILFQLLGIVDGENGYAVFLGEQEEENVAYGIGTFENSDNLIAEMNADLTLSAAFSEGKILINEENCFIPLIIGGKKLGGLYIESNGTIANFFDRELLEVFKNQMVQLVLNTLYHHEIVIKEEEVVTDPLTGLYNRRFLNQRLEEELNRAARFKHRIAVLMIDLDDFKKINDTFGHEAGDLVLKNVGNVLRMAVRDFDIVGRNVQKIGDIGQFAVRYGGEEFCVILLQSNDEGAIIVGERIRKNIEERLFDNNGTNIRVTASIGICSNLINHEHVKKDFMGILTRNADKALYLAKSSGKNKVLLYDQEMK